ncbi:DUF1329 domain-containing protein [Acidocella sp.]|uniref:DUF1329 domain-containing protein n=1 Tax=Acidocella sp. TaxID=50710 RepID=UPI00260DC194|nr:DUF1329 domain-containing protein [Acidocella sp.]
MDVPSDNRQTHVSAMSEIADEVQRASAIANTLNNNQSFCTDPGQYEWKYIDKKFVVVPFKHAPSNNGTKSTEVLHVNLLDTNTRWEKHLAWIVEGSLRNGESNILSRRLFYLAETSWQILYGEGFSGEENLISCYMLSRGQMGATSRHGTWYAMLSSSLLP